PLGLWRLRRRLIPRTNEEVSCDRAPSLALRTFLGRCVPFAPYRSPTFPLYGSSARFRGVRLGERRSAPESRKRRSSRRLGPGGTLDTRRGPPPRRGRRHRSAPWRFARALLADLRRQRLSTAHGERRLVS